MITKEISVEIIILNKIIITYSHLCLLWIIQITFWLLISNLNIWLINFYLLLTVLKKLKSLWIVSPTNYSVSWISMLYFVNILINFCWFLCFDSIHLIFISFRTLRSAFYIFLKIVLDILFYSFLSSSMTCCWFSFHLINFIFIFFLYLAFIIKFALWFIFISNSKIILFYFHICFCLWVFIFFIFVICFLNFSLRYFNIIFTGILITYLWVCLIL